MSESVQSPSFELIDSHLHLDMEAFDEDREEVIERALESGVSKMITIGCGLSSCREAIALAERHKAIFATVGVHPHRAQDATSEELEAISALLEHPRVVGVGETGLDFFYMMSPREVQIDIFRHFTKLAIERELPLIIHTRDAEEETLAILEEERKGQPIRGVIHCFNGSFDFAMRCLEMGFYLSIPGMITFLTALKRVAKKLPLERLLVETDSPFLAPNPHRGKRNEPAFVVETARKLSDILGVSLEELARVTTQNTNELFGLEEISF